MALVQFGGDQKSALESHRIVSLDRKGDPLNINPIVYAALCSCIVVPNRPWILSIYKFTVYSFLASFSFKVGLDFYYVIGQFWSIFIEKILIVIKISITLEEITYLLTYLLCSVWFEPTDVTHIWKISQTDLWNSITYTSPNFAELQQMVASLDSQKMSTQRL